MRILISILFLLAAYTNASADTHNAASCSNADIQTAIDASSDGDTVTVPAGTCAWSGTVTIAAAKGITLQGAGIGSTNITDAHITLYTAAASSPTRITGFSLTWADGNCIRVNPDFSRGSDDWRIDNINFTFTPTGWAEAAIWISGWTFGLVDSCVFNGVPRGVFVESQDYTYDNPGGRYYGDYSWTQGIDLGTPASGYPRATYVENCTFNNPKTAGDQTIESRYGGRYVFRYNTVRGYTTTTHSGCTNNGRNPVQAEIYNNTMTYSNYYRAINIRTTGVAMVFNNTITGGYSVFADFRQEESCLGCSANGPYASAPYESYPMTDNIGRSPPSQDLTPWYEWANTLGGDTAHFTRGGTCAAEQTMVQEDRDYYAASYGLIAARPGTCTPKEGYYATDESILYQCTATNTWTSYYTPYTYPHPLRSGEPPPGDETPPTLYSASPSGILQCIQDPMQITESIQTNENSTVKIHATDVAYDSMGTTLTTSNNRYHYRVIERACGATYGPMYARGMDTAENKNTSSTNIGPYTILSAPIYTTPGHSMSLTAGTSSLVISNAAGTLTILTVETAPSATTYTWREAEAGTLTSPMAQSADENASGGYYISTPNDGEGQATFSLTLSAGSYIIWGRIYVDASGGQDDNSFYVQLGSGTNVLWDTPTGVAAWAWDKVSSRGALAPGETDYDPFVWEVLSGTYTLTIFGRESGTKIDKILITSDANYTPTGLGE